MDWDVHGPFRLSPALTTIREGVMERNGVDGDVHRPFRLSPDSDHDPGRRAGAIWSGLGCTWTISSLPGL